MPSPPGTMLLRCSARSNHRTSVASIQARRSVSSGPFVGSSTVIPPESPRYVYLPKPPQQAPNTLVLRKGTLPVPRKPLERTKKQLPWHLENTAPDRLNARSKIVNSAHKELSNWKSTESDLRRKNFLEGYSSLRLREAGRPSRRSKEEIQAANAKLNLERATEPSYEEMSRPSILSYMDKPETWKAPKRTQEEVDARRIRHEEIQQAKEYERRTNLHTLYVNAKNFIVNAEQLEKKLTEVYDSDFYQYNKDKDYGIWDEEGWPEDTTYLMTRAQSNQGVSAVDQETGYSEAARRRIMKVTEEMTGGKLVHDAKQVQG